ncbi:hypothetical protein CHS0354_023077, partial [Potamilus streckersoni]
MARLFFPDNSRSQSAILANDSSRKTNNSSCTDHIKSDLDNQSETVNSLYYC